jgi:hypothetical protein
MRCYLVPSLTHVGYGIRWEDICRFFLDLGPLATGDSRSVIESVCLSYLLSIVLIKAHHLIEAADCTTEGIVKAFFSAIDTSC